MTNLARNATSVILGEIGSRLFGFLATTYLARTLQPESFGLISVALAVFGYLIILVSLGIPFHGLRLMAQRDPMEEEIVGDVLGIRTFLGLVGLLGLGVASFSVMGDETLSLLCVLYGLSIVPLALNLEWVFQGKETMQPVGWNRVVGNGVYVLALIVAVQTREDVLRAPLAFFLGNAVASVLLLMWLCKARGTIRFHWKPSTLIHKDGRWRDIMRRSLPIGAGAALLQVSSNLPPIILGFAVSVTAAGLFSAAGRLVFFLLVFDRLIASLLLPVIVRYKKFAPDQLPSMLALVQKFVLILAAPLSIGGMVLADDVIRVVYGRDFVDAAPILRIFIWYFFFSIASSVYTLGLLGIDQEKTYGRAVVRGTLVQVGATVLGTMFLGTVGAALGFVIGEAFLFWLMCSRFSTLHRFNLIPIFLKPFLAAAGMAIVLVPTLSYGLVVTIPLGICVFFILLMAMKGLTKEDFVLMRAKLL